MKITIAQLRYWREECEWSYNDIAEHTGIPPSTIAGRCQSLNLYPKNKVIPSDRRRKRPGLVKHFNIDPELIRKLYWDDELSSTEVGQKLNIPKRSIITLMQYHGIPKRNQTDARRLAARRLRENGKAMYNGSIEQARQNGIKSGITRREQTSSVNASRSSNKAA